MSILSFREEVKYCIGKYTERIVDNAKLLSDMYREYETHPKVDCIISVASAIQSGSFTERNWAQPVIALELALEDISHNTEGLRKIYKQFCEGYYYVNEGT